MRLYTSILILLFGCFAHATARATNDCFSQLSEQLALSVPAVGVGGTLIAADLDYSATGPTAEAAIWFRLTSVAAASVTDCTYPAPLFVDGATLIVRLPVVEFNGFTLWAELAYVPTSDGQVWFKVLDFGLPAHRMFLTSVTGTGDLSTWPDAGGAMGIAAGDAICQARAQAAGLPGTYVAWLSDSVDDAYCRLHGLAGKKGDNCGQMTLPVSAGPWMRTDGFPFGATIEQLIEDGAVFAPIATDEFGAAAPIPHTFRTGSTTEGMPQTVGSGTCLDWSSDASEERALSAQTGDTSFRWGGVGGSLGCSVHSRMLCFQMGSGGPLPNFARPGKLAFASSVAGGGNLSGWDDANGQTGIAAGDAICQARAAAAGLPNALRFKAWLSDSSVDAGDRLSSDGPWVRADGVVVAENRADLTDELLFSSITLNELGEISASRAWTGTEEDGVGDMDHCGDWTQGDVAAQGLTGSLFNVGAWTGLSTRDCDNSFPLYCFED